MKKYIFILSGILTSALANGQSVIPQIIPCLTVTQSNLPDLGSGIEATDCIETDGNVTFIQYENYSIKAGEYIHFGQNTSINPDASHQFHAYIDNGGMEVAWYYPNATPGTVGQFEKLELGVEFRDDIDQLIENFTHDNNQISPNLNPFNPEQVDLFAEFWWYNDGSSGLPFPVGWYGPQKINGFYYEEYVRPSVDADDYLLVTNQHDFRIRFAPRRTGLWRCKITAHVQGFGTMTASEFTFNCVDSDSKDFMRVGDNGRYFKIGDEPFFPVGHNVVWPRAAIGDGPNPRSYPEINPPSFYETYHDQMTKVVQNGGNYMRFINSPWSTDCEFEKLNDYSDRMIHSWEMDEILNHADAIDLKIHFNLQIHYNFELPDIYGYFQWDWSATGDPPYNTGPTCMPLNDSGYCYRSDLGISDPVDFFTNPDAMKFYQYKLRYLIARYGYSNEIAVLELFSEINNAGSKRHMELTDGGCKRIDGTEIKPYLVDPTFPGEISAWQHEMAKYIKETLKHTNHPLAVSYGGEPENGNGDNSYQSEYIDIITYNRYQNLVEKNSKTVFDVNEYDYIGKPMMFPEYGTWGLEQCDNGVDFIKTLTLTPFSGTAGAAMNWDWQYPGQEFLWHHMGPVNELMSGIKLDEENWEARPPIVSSNKGVEVLYLRNFVEDNYRVVGAVSNRTYNYYTQGTDSVCVPSLTNLPNELQSDSIYRFPQDFEHPIGTEVLMIPFMGFEIGYKINWYNALTGDSLGTGFNISDEFGNFPLVFPLISGDETRPILFFEIYRSDEPTFKTVLADTLSSEKEILAMRVDSVLESIVVTDWENNSNIRVTISPNPTLDIVDVFVSAENTFGFTWSLYNLIGDQMVNGEVTNQSFSIDISKYPAGLYFLKISDGTKKHILKIVKS